MDLLAFPFALRFLPVFFLLPFLFFLFSQLAVFDLCGRGEGEGGVICVLGGRTGGRLSFLQKTRKHRRKAGPHREQRMCPLYDGGENGRCQKRRISPFSLQTISGSLFRIPARVGAEDRRGRDFFLSAFLLPVLPHRYISATFDPCKTDRVNFFCFRTE